MINKPALFHAQNSRTPPLTLLLAIGAVVFGAIPAKAAIDFYRLDKAVAYSQTASDTQPTTPAYFFGGFDLRTPTPADLTSAKVTSTTTAFPEIVLPQVSAGYWNSAQYYTSLGEMDQALPSGQTYQFSIAGGTLGAQSALLSAPANDLFSPSIPYFVGTTFDQFQGLNPSAPFTARWNAFAIPSGANDGPVFFSIARVSDNQSIVNVGLANATTSYELAANVLALNTEYRASVVFSSRIVTVDAGFAVGDSLVEFDLITDLQFNTRLPGDYNRNHVVDAADYTLWRNTLGQTDVTPFAGADGDGDGKILRADYDIWKNNFGISAPGFGVSSVVPEPLSAMLASFAILSLRVGSWRRGEARSAS